MIHRSGDFPVEVREAMRGGDKSVKITHFFDEKNDLNSATRLCALLELEPGASIGYHTHDAEEEMFIVLSGRGEINDNGVIAEVKPGDSIVTGNGSGHGVRAIGNETLKLMAVIVTFAK